MEKYVPEYLKYKIENGYSAYTISSERSAFSKFYGHDFNSVDIPLCKRENIFRGKDDSVHSSTFSFEKNKELVNFLSSTGLRRNELLHLTGSPDRIVYQNGHYFINLKDGTKGGRPRLVRILNDDKNAIEIIKATKDGERVFKGSYSHLNIHKIRGQYARAMYEQIASERNINVYRDDLNNWCCDLPYSDKYICRGSFSGNEFSREVFEELTQYLGHNRDTVLMNYMHDVD